MFQALLGLRDTFKHTNTRRSSQYMIAGIQRDCAFLCFANMPLVLSQLQRSAVECRFLHCLPMAYKRPKFAKMGTCQMPSCTGSNFSVLGGHDGIVSEIIWMMLSALLLWTRCEKSRKSL